MFCSVARLITVGIVHHGAHIRGQLRTLSCNLSEQKYFVVTRRTDTAWHLPSSVLQGIKGGGFGQGRYGHCT